MDVLILHKGLEKVESLLASQLIMGTNGMEAFVLRPESSLCLPPFAAAAGQQTAKHIFILFSRQTGARHKLVYKLGNLLEYSKLLGTAEGLQKTTKCVMQREMLRQFRGARDALYGHFLSRSQELKPRVHSVRETSKYYHV